MGNFRKDIRRGKRGEEIVCDFLLQCENILDVIDVSKEKEYQDIDVDFIVLDVEGEETLVEVKTDSYKTENMVYEFYSSRKRKTVGCFEKTKADYIFYYYINKKQLYIFDTMKLREFVHEKAEAGEFKLINMGDAASGYKIALNTIPKNVYHYVDL